MRRTGVAVLPLHEGSVPKKLILHMTKLSSAVISLIIRDYGTDEVLRRISDPFWFQAFGCALGFDWHSSGLTTVVTGVLKNAIKPEHGILILGGKGALSRKVPEELELATTLFNISENKLNELKYASRMTAKVDNTAIQDGYQLYHHTFFLSEKSMWAVVQQGMDTSTKTARRYHWISEKINNFIDEPHTGIAGDIKKESVLDMTANRSKEARSISVDLVKEGPKRIMNDLRSITKGPLDEWLGFQQNVRIDILYLPKKINWNAIRQAYEIQPKNYEELLSIQGIGPAAVRALALISELVYGKPASWKDPIKYTFAHGGKDGVPYPVDFITYKRTISTLEEAIKEAELGREEKISALKRLSNFIYKFEKS
ncbi:MAG: DUF763 domain-containing protein [Thermoprotei archaeon]